MGYKVVFMGSPEFALPALIKLAEVYTVTGVVTQPDQPAGRGRKLSAPPIKTLAQQLGFSVIQPPRLRDSGVYEQLVNWKPDLIVVAAYGKIVKQNILDLPHYGCINVHASLLPRWRGAAPIQAAILHGDQQTGITIMKMDAGLDTGPILAQQAIDILADDTAGSLSGKLAHLGGDLLLATLPKYLENRILPVAQEESRATHAGSLTKDDGLLNFSQTATSLERMVRAFNPWPSAFTSWQGGIFKVLRATISSGEGGSPGSRIEIQGKPAVQCSEGILVFEVVQPAGKTPMPGEVFLRGARDWRYSS